MGSTNNSSNDRVDINAVYGIVRGPMRLKKWQCYRIWQQGLGPDEVLLSVRVNAMELPVWEWGSPWSLAWICADDVLRVSGLPVQRVRSPRESTHAIWVVAIMRGKFGYIHTEEKLLHILNLVLCAEWFDGCSKNVSKEIFTSAYFFMVNWYRDVDLSLHLYSVSRLWSTVYIREQRVSLTT